MISKQIPRWVHAMVRFGIKGGAGVLLNIGLLTVVVDIVGLPAEYGILAVWGLTLIPGYLVTDKWVFTWFPSPDGVTGHGQRGSLFYGVMWGGKAVNYGLYLLFLEIGIFYQAAWFVGAVLVFPITFGVNYLLWKKNPSGWRDVIGWLRSHSI